MCLIADAVASPPMIDALLLAASSWGHYLLVILQVVLGLGAVIFVHELGHFAVAKWCGVRCDRFYVGFDPPIKIGPIRLPRALWKKKIGETEYGIGVLPLGGYVKMYGQDDTVASVEEMLELSKSNADDPEAVEVTGPGGETYWINRRHYMAKSVPQRMAIISAGVVMNIIFAFVFAFFAYGLGVPKAPTVVASTTPGGPAWSAGLRTGDRIVRADGIENPTFEQFISQVMLGDLDAGVECVVKRYGTETTETIVLHPDQSDALPRVGISTPVTPRVSAENPTVPHSPASAAPEGSFQPGDLIVEANGEPVTNYADLISVLERHKSQDVTYTLLRGAKKKAGDSAATGGERVSVTVGPNPMERFGVVATLGPVQAVQAGSPAAEAGLEAGDRLLSVNGVAIGAGEDGAEAYDPVTLDDRLAALAAAGETVTLAIERAGAEEPIVLSVAPRAPTWPERSFTDNAPLALTSLGVACPLIAEVQAVIADSPAAAVDLKPGDRIVSVAYHSTDKADGAPAGMKPIPLTDESPAWPSVLLSVQDKSSDFRADFEVLRDGKKHPVTLGVRALGDAFVETRGIGIEPLKEIRRAQDLGEQVSMAGESTWSALTSVYRFLSKIGTQVPVTALGGPITIAKVAGASAFEGPGALLLFLTMLSANLAVLNFLPIPVLDGGHMVFLAWEGLRGRPAGEKVVTTLTGAGMLFLLGFMAFIFALDLGILPRGL
ncbi:Regulator of sigma-E protease RseP [Pseudobythopirellula maris]|uniref:Regulator of sigma-E protease RseP n=1 Tax=Pseudobythopirellula maris TaxID=2527991 RepID=A0A5C5ZMD2_9BACT|nr:site-2 protease family protein [Pseudobythopirellula maris]TWT88147.1 Regulator of sigma-E protease RseP [Pseudobythopirellula maris]